MTRKYAAALCGLMIALTALGLVARSARAAIPTWNSPLHYRVLLTVDPKGVTRKNSPATLSINIPSILTTLGVSGTFDEAAVDVVGYDANGGPRIYDASRSGYERYLLPWRLDHYYKISSKDLSFVMPDQLCTQYAVYFDTVESGMGQPDRYPGLVGNGDWFTEGYKRREIGGCRYDGFCDLDNDGDLDLFKGGTEPYIYCYENVGGGKFIDQGKMTNNGVVMTVPYDGDHRSWHTIAFCDWDNDGKKDMFIWSPTGTYADKILRYRNTGTPSVPKWASPVVLTTSSGLNFTTNVSHMCFTDWNGDGKKDLLIGRDSTVAWHRNTGTDISPVLDNGTYVYANGAPIDLLSANPEVADIDADGDLDLFVGSECGRIYLFKNVGTRTSPVFMEGRIIAYHDGGYEDAGCAVKVADFDGDGLLDFTAGRYWERTHWGEEPRMYGRLYKNVGTLTQPRFEARDAYNGGLYTERFQICDAVRQNCVRSVDWNNDGLMDLVAGDTDGYVWYFRNTTNRLHAVFAMGERLHGGGQVIQVFGEEERRVWAGYARPDICDWNNDSKKELIVADGRGWITLYLNEGTDADPILGAGQRVWAHNLPIDGTGRSSVMVCDWNKDGKKDVLFAMVGQNNYTAYGDWPHINTDYTADRGYLFYKNIGTDANPVLDFPKWLVAGSGNTIIDYTRPNMGEYIDWDGDGKNDFIGAEFEHNIRFYKNTASGGVNVEPAFTSSYDGVKIVMPWTVQMVSGVDVIDWNQDGDLDVLTGQGHGGTGLRYYERDYCNDFVNSTFPTVAVGASSRGISIADARAMANSATSYTVHGGTVTAAFSGFYYIENEDRSAGIRVEMANHGRTIGEKLDVVGTVSTTTADERRIVATSVVLYP